MWRKPSPELLLSWTPEDLEAMMEAWKDRPAPENPYAVGDRKTMRNGGEKYLTFVVMVLKKK